MAQIEMQLCENKKSKRKLHAPLRIDMTPMVDLGFLLITFFIFTTTMSEKKVMKLFMPANGTPTPTAESKVLTVLLGHNSTVLTYEGNFEDAVKENKLLQTNYSESDGIGKLIREKQKRLQSADEKNGKDELVLLIKPSGESSYKNVIDALDEATINGVKKYMITDVSPVEKSELSKIKN